MQNLAPNHFFDLSQFAHAALFDGCEYVWQALDKIQGYLQAYSLGKIEAQEQKYAYLVNPNLISIGEGTIIEPGAYIKGPCIIGKNCHIRHGAYIRGDCIIGDSCVIGHTTEMKHSIILNHSNAAHFAYLGDTILGSHVNLGAGVKCANLRLDGKPIVVHIDGKKIATGRRKFGAIIGDQAEVGCNSVLNPGTLLGKASHAYPSVNFGGYIEANSLVQPEVTVKITKKGFHAN
jgi:UDP-N-acetylglucosamine diphosphorylase / glucose-1-phosphate thymidylyltransferase / UDP-N-acetylgalactosamine diphosphorylase / glucosamine-1-phosphate N-acetyltransferase / galactosamine-1-phosphate N-acetyltransferase